MTKHYSRVTLDDRLGADFGVSEEFLAHEAIDNRAGGAEKTVALLLPVGLYNRIERDNRSAIERGESSRTRFQSLSSNLKTTSWSAKSFSI